MSRHNKDRREHNRRQKQQQQQQPDVSGLEHLAVVRSTENTCDQVDRLLAEGRKDEAEAMALHLMADIFGGTLSEADLRDAIVGEKGECVAEVWAWIARAAVVARVPMHFAFFTSAMGTLRPDANGLRRIPKYLHDWVIQQPQAKIEEWCDRLAAAGLVKLGERNAEGMRTLEVLMRK